MHKSKLIKFVLIIKNCCFPYFSNFTKIFIKLYFCSSSINCTYNMGGKNRFDQNEQCASVVSIQKNFQNNYYTNHMEFIQTTRLCNSDQRKKNDMQQRRAIFSNNLRVGSLTNTRVFLTPVKQNVCNIASLNVLLQKSPQARAIYCMYL